MSGYGKPLRSFSKPNLETASPYDLTEVDLQTESNRLEKMLSDGSLDGEKIKRLEDVRKCLERFAALKIGKAIPSRPLASRRASIECRNARIK